METLKNEISKPVARVLETINVPITLAFNYIQPVSLSTIFPGYNTIPAILKKGKLQ